jgi:hypothetical protein
MSRIITRTDDVMENPSPHELKPGLLNSTYTPLRHQDKVLSVIPIHLLCI